MVLGRGWLEIRIVRSVLREHEFFSEHWRFGMRAQLLFGLGKADDGGLKAAMVLRYP